ncbi:hypothetical protein [Fodinicola acaciae]|uniref:hypothetical protein n=1 Tax=Fodinicola acaciae TaxID=2681555 RepID=UPI0013D7D9EA|nr:hypothetical protein [Fodinicola acaciae]
MSYRDDRESMPSGLPYDVPGRGGAGVPFPSPQPLTPQSGPPVSGGRPTAVTLAGLCLIADIAVFVVSFALVVINQDAFVAETQRQLQQLTPDLPFDIPTFVRVTLFGMALVQLLISVVIAVFALLLMRRRRIPWILATILSWLFLIGQVVAFLSTAGTPAPEDLQAANAVGQVLTGMSILMIGVAAVALVLPSSARWFLRR